MLAVEGGILSESLAKEGAQVVTGIDQGENVIRIAKLTYERI